MGLWIINYEYFHLYVSLVLNHFQYLYLFLPYFLPFLYFLFFIFLNISPHHSFFPLYNILLL